MIDIRSNLTTLGTFDGNVWEWRINKTDICAIGAAKIVGNQLNNEGLPDIIHYPNPT